MNTVKKETRKKKVKKANVSKGSLGAKIVSNFSLDKIADNPLAFQNSKRLGRGIGSGKGKTSGKGHKGQKARAGATRGYFEGGQMPLYRRFPKRGFISRALPFRTIDFSKIELALKKKLLTATKTITEDDMKQIGWFNPAKHRGIKLLNRGEIETKYSLKISKASLAASQRLTKFGGKIELIEIAEKSNKTEDKQTENKKVEENKTEDKKPD